MARKACGGTFRTSDQRDSRPCFSKAQRSSHSVNRSSSHRYVFVQILGISGLDSAAFLSAMRGERPISSGGHRLGYTVTIASSQTGALRRAAESSIRIPQQQRSTQDSPKLHWMGSCQPPTSSSACAFDVFLENRLLKKRHPSGLKPDSFLFQWELAQWL